MSATSKTFPVTLTSTGGTYDLSADNLVLVEASGSGSKVTYQLTEDAVPIIAVVDESPSAISTASQYLISVTDATTSTAFYLNPDRISEVLDNSSAAYILYDRGYNEDFKFSVTQSRSTIRTAIAAVVSSGGSGSVTTGLTAFAGGGQGSATQTSFGYNEFTTVATAGDSGKLPTGVVAGRVTVLNDGAATMDLYPATGGTINDGGANVAVQIAPGNEVTFVAITTTNWETDAQTIAAGNGTAALPSFTFESDADSGLYRIGANNIGVAANGAKVLDIATTGLGVTGSVTGSTIALMGAGAVGAPSYSFSGAATQGMYNVSGTQLGFAVAGSLKGGFDSNGVFTDVISEQTGAVGVTIDSLLIKDNTATAVSFINKGNAATTGYGLQTLKSTSAFKTMAGGATEVIDVDIPVGAIIMGVQLRNDTIIVGAGATTYSAAFSGGSIASISSGTAFAKNTKANLTLASQVIGSVAKITLTPDAGTLDTGTVTAVVYYFELTSIIDAP